MLRRTARRFLSVWLAIAALPLAACAVPPSQAGWSAQAPAQLGASFPAALSASGSPDNAAEEPSQSRALTDYLHRRRLPLVAARVLAARSGERRVILYGFVAGAFGKADAADRAREFLRDPGARVENRIKIAPELANQPAAPADNSSAGNSSNDLKEYENQQFATQQRQQYQNQSSAGMMPLLPLLGLFGSFSSGGMGYGFGAAPWGGFGPGWGAYPPSPFFPGAPGMGYPFPYSPVFP